MKKVSELQGGGLDYWVARALGNTTGNASYMVECNLPDDTWTPSTNWSQCGPIIDGHAVSLYANEVLIDLRTDRAVFTRFGSFSWYARAGQSVGFGPTPLIAAMRVFVASKFGDEVE